VSKYWNPKTGKARGPVHFRPARGRWRPRNPFTSRDIWIVPAGLFAGLLYASVAGGLISWPGASREASADVATPKIVDPYAESRQSRAILEAQEGAPEPAVERSGGLAPARAGGSEAGDPAGVRMVDGDTFDYRGQRIRIADIDTPEVHGRCARESELAAQATARMGALIAAGPFRLESGGDREFDRYGRRLRIVTRGGRSLGQILVAEGLAHPWVGHKLPWCV
jgi:endonuclease YncB( thermonuclease family)